MTDWFVTQRVVCVDDQYTDGSGKIPEYELNAVYTVREIVFRTMILFLFDEFQKFNDRGDEIWNPAWRFRPLVETKTDISVFERALNPVAPKVKEFA